jgi:hypothetical protein
MVGVVSATWMVTTWWGVDPHQGDLLADGHDHAAVAGPALDPDGFDLRSGPRSADPGLRKRSTRCGRILVMSDIGAAHAVAPMVDEGPSWFRRP